jgi:hypothetical protein
MIYVKAFLVGVATFILAFTLILAFMMHRAFEQPPVVPANAEVSFDFNSEWVDTWQPFLIGTAAFVGTFYWTLRRFRNRNGASRV